MIPKARRISIKIADEAKRRKAIELKETFFRTTPQEGKIRIYEVPGENAHLLHVITPQGSQKILKAIERGGKIEFEQVGYSDSGFNRREVFGGMKRRGIATKMLKANEANERALGRSLLERATARKSVANFFMKRGYALNLELGQGLLKKAGIHTPAELKQYLEKESTPEKLPTSFWIRFTKKIKGNREKTK